MDIIHSELLYSFIETKQIFIDPCITSLQSIFGESASICLDLNLTYYGLEYTESILAEWNENSYEPKLALCLSNDITNITNIILAEEEGSVSILEALI